MSTAESVFARISISAQNGASALSTASNGTPPQSIAPEASDRILGSSRAASPDAFAGFQAQAQDFEIFVVAERADGLVVFGQRLHRGAVEVDGVHRLADMQGARPAFGVRPAPIVEAVGAVGVFLYFERDIVGAEGVHCPLAHEHEVAGVRIAEFEQFLHLSGFCRPLNCSGETPFFSPAIMRDFTPQPSRYHASFLRGSPYFFSEAPLGCTCSESLWRASSSLTIIGKNLSGRQPGPMMSSGYFSIARLSVSPPSPPPEISDDALGESHISSDSPILNPLGIDLPKSVLKERPPQMRSSYMGLNFRRFMLAPFLRGPL